MSREAAGIARSQGAWRKASAPAEALTTSPYAFQPRWPQSLSTLDFSHIFSQLKASH